MAAADADGCDLFNALLSDALLEHIFVLACAPEPGAAPHGRTPAVPLPLVCRRWACIYGESTLLWEHVAMDWGDVMQRFVLRVPPDEQVARFRSVMRFLERRAPVTSHLHFSGCAVLFEQLQHQVAAFCSRARRLQSLCLSDVVGCADGTVCQLAACASLRTLSLRCQEMAAGRLLPLVVSVSALQALSALPLLTSLELAVDRIAGSTRDLQEALARLSHLSVRCREEAAILHPELLSVVSCLQRLKLSNCRLAQFTPPQVAVLARLTHLGCRDVMAAQPRKGGNTTLWEALRSLGGLRELVMEDQTNARVGLPLNALACTGLQGLTVLRSSMTDWPSAASITVDPGCLGGLRSLHLGFLTLEQPIPAVFWHALTSLTHLRWQQIRLTGGGHRENNVLLPKPPIMEVPHGISRLAVVRTLAIDYCELQAVPTCVQALTTLESLSLEGNRIADLPAGQYLMGIHHLSLAANDLRVVPEGLLTASNLRLVSLARNPLLEVTQDAADVLLERVPHLERLCVTPKSAAGGAEVLARLNAQRHGVVHWGEAPPGLW